MATSRPLPIGDDLEYQRNLEMIRERVARFARRAGCGDAAEDVGQECIAVLIEKYSEKRDPCEMTKIAIGISRNKMRERARQEQHQVELSDMTDHEADIHRELERSQVTDLFLKAVKRLSERCRKLVALLIEEKGFAEIKTELGAEKLSNVYTWKNRCFEELRKLLGDLGESVYGS